MKIYSGELKNEKFYWKVHIRNYDSFISYILKMYKNFNNEDMYCFRSSYRGEDYIYLVVKYNEDGTYRLSYSVNTDNSRRWLIINDWKYKGEYNGRREKLERLAVVSSRNGV